jgi:CheY-like chemotaxis protein
VAIPENTPRRILVVDDDSLVCESIRRILELDQHQVEIATSGHDALAAVQRAKFDLIILDYEMPGSKGDALAASIKAKAPQQSIIMITGHTEALRLAGNFPLTVDLVINKPFDMQELREAVRKKVGEQASRLS